MRDDPVWFDEPEEVTDHRHGPRRTVVIAIAAVPWVLVAALVLLSDRSVDPATPAGPPAVAADPGHDVDTQSPSGPAAGAATEEVTEGSRPTDPAGPSGSAPARPLVPEDGSAAADAGAAWHHRLSRELATRDALTAVATVVARAWLTGVSPHLDVPGLTPTDPATYAEHVVVEAIEQDDPHLAVVSVLAVLLRETSEGLRVETRRVAVPLAITDGHVQPAGAPWWLPTPDLRSVELPTETQTDPAWFEAAATALQAAGLQDVEVTALERTDRWPWRAHITARTAGGGAIDGPVWLRWNGQGFELAGTVPASTSSQAPPPVAPPVEPSAEPLDGDPLDDTQNDPPGDAQNDVTPDDAQEAGP